jgi:hypothetical protein
VPFLTPVIETAAPAKNGAVPIAQRMGEIMRSGYHTGPPLVTTAGPYRTRSTIARLVLAGIEAQATPTPLARHPAPDGINGHGGSPAGWSAIPTRAIVSYGPRAEAVAHRVTPMGVLIDTILAEPGADSSTSPSAS